MYMVTVEVLNRYAEVEQSKTFFAQTQRSAAIQAGKWCADGWGKEWRKAFIIVRRVCGNDVVWELQ